MSEDRIEGGVKQGVGRVQDAVGGLTGSDKTQAKGKLNEATGSAQDAYGKVKDKVQDAAGQVRDQVQDAGDRASDVFGQVEDFVREQPLQALAGGIAVGIVVGLFLRGGRKTVYLSK